MGHHVGQSILKYVIISDNYKIKSSSHTYFYLQILVPHLVKMAQDDKFMDCIVTANRLLLKVRGQAGQGAPPSDEEMQVRHLS